MSYKLFADYIFLHWAKLAPIGGLVLLVLFPFGMQGQSFAKLVESADQLWAKGDYAGAASAYEQAARLKQNQPETMLLAAEAYYALRDYAKAAECYGFGEKALPKNDLIWLRYGRSLKQAGKPTEAIEVFRKMRGNYAQADREKVAAIIDTEIKGCQMAVQLPASQDTVYRGLVLRRLSDSLNSPENEFAPIRWNDDVLYFFSKARGKTELLRSLRSDGNWQSPQPATGLPSAIWADLGSGSLSPDGQRFYYTRCPEERDASGAYPPCALYVTRRAATGTWGEPERLRDYINLPGSTILTPFVTQSDDIERLFFASDRPGGFGGLDLYGCERPLNSEDLDFSFPQNVGSVVNSAGDELTPYFDPASTTLWFSSNGQITLGGLDVFTSIYGDHWGFLTSMESPVNSPADDLFFVPNLSTQTAIVVSNRLFGPAKTSTRHNDLFEIQPLR